MRNGLLIKTQCLQNLVNVVCLAILAFLPGYVAADMEFLSIADNAVIMYDAPSTKAEKLYVASIHLPVEAVVNVDGWVKVRDSSGSLAWVEMSALSSKRYVIVTTPLANVYQTTDTNATLVLQLEENVVVEWLGSFAMGWVKVRYRDGQTGYIKVNQVWGL